MEPHLEFLLCCSISKRFYLQCSLRSMAVLSSRAHERLSSSLQDEEYFKGGGAAGGL